MMEDTNGVEEYAYAGEDGLGSTGTSSSFSSSIDVVAANGRVDDEITSLTDTRSVPEIELIIKASTIDGRRKGACIFCQEYFMDLYLLAELKTISLKITTVDMKRPPADFRSNFEAAQPPILIDSGIAILENEKIERHIMKHIPGGHNLFVADPEAAKKIENLYSKFKMMLVACSASPRDEEAARKNLIKILKRLDETLAERGTRFLTGDTLCCFDCELMPKLQHIRVAGRHFVNFDIPAEFSHLWAYMKEMYELDAFVQSCPADQDIIHMYKMQLNSSSATGTLDRKGKMAATNPNHQMNRLAQPKEELELPTYSMTAP